MEPESRTTPRRERARAATVEEIKQTAVKLMDRRGSTEVTFTEIARAMEMSPPALYRYFADRDELLGALVVDGFTSLGEHVAKAYADTAGGDIAECWMAVAGAYRRWARSETVLFSLIFGLPAPGCTAPTQGPTIEAARGTLNLLSRLFVDARDQGVLGEPLITDVHPALVAGTAMRNAKSDVEVSPVTFQAMLHSWAILHGFVALETCGHFEWMGEEARDSLFRNHLRLAATAAGMPVAEP